MRLRLYAAPVVALGLSALTAAGVQAQDPGRAQRFEQRDGNRDGVLSRDEYVSTGGHPGNFQALDRNNDGVLSREEFGAGPAGAPGAPAGPVADAFRVVDRNNDGFISRGEWNDDDSSFNRLDRNNDGRLTRDEHANPLDPNSAEGRFGDLDRNNDGWLTRSEFGVNRVAFDRADRDDDGRVRLDEYVSYTNSQGSGETARFRQLDLNHDRWLSRSEFGVNRAVFDRADRNNDGRVSLSEYLNPRPEDNAAARFDVLDRNHDRVLVRSEWRDEGRAFDRLDQDDDGRITRDEYVDPPALDDREARFHTLDRNNDGVVSRGEWRNEPLPFGRVDWNNDGTVSFREYWDRGLADDDVDTGWVGRFRDYDRNGDGVITRSEWRGDAETFALLDTSRNGVVERREVNDPTRLADRFRTLDHDRDGWVSRQEWRGSTPSFNLFDLDGDGRLSRVEYVGND